MDTVVSYNKRVLEFYFEQQTLIASTYRANKDKLLEIWQTRDQLTKEEMLGYNEFEVLLLDANEKKYDAFEAIYLNIVKAIEEKKKFEFFDADLKRRFDDIDQEINLMHDRTMAVKYMVFKTKNDERLYRNRRITELSTEKRTLAKEQLYPWIMTDSLYFFIFSMPVPVHPTSRAGQVLIKYGTAAGAD